MVRRWPAGLPCTRPASASTMACSRTTGSTCCRPGGVEVTGSNPRAAASRIRSAGGSARNRPTKRLDESGRPSRMGPAPPPERRPHEIEAAGPRWSEERSCGPRQTARGLDRVYPCRMSPPDEGDGGEPPRTKHMNVCSHNGLPSPDQRRRRLWPFPSRSARTLPWLSPLTGRAYSAGRGPAALRGTGLKRAKLSPQHEAPVPCHPGDAPPKWRPTGPPFSPRPLGSMTFIAAASAQQQPQVTPECGAAGHRRRGGRHHRSRPADCLSRAGQARRSGRDLGAGPYLAAGFRVPALSGQPAALD